MDWSCWLSSKIVNNYDTFEKIFDFNETNNLKFIKSQIFNVSLNGLKPNTKLFSFLDTVSIDAYIVPKDYQLPQEEILTLVKL